MRLLCYDDHGRGAVAQDPLVEQLRAEVAYLRGELRDERGRSDHYRDAFEMLVSQRMKLELEALRTQRTRGAGGQGDPPDAEAPGAPPMAPWMETTLHAGGHLEEDRERLPNLGASEEELAEETIEFEAQRREEERLAAAGRRG